MTLHVITQVIARLPSNLIYKITRSYEFIWLLFWGASHDERVFRFSVDFSCKYSHSFRLSFSEANGNNLQEEFEDTKETVNRGKAENTIAKKKKDKKRSTKYYT